MNFGEHFRLFNGHEEETRLWRVGMDIMMILMCVFIVPYLFFALTSRMAGEDLQANKKELGFLEDNLKDADANIAFFQERAMWGEQQIVALEEENERYIRTAALAEDYALAFVLQPVSMRSSSYDYELVVTT